MPNVNPVAPLSIRNLGSNGVMLDGVVDEYLVPAGAVSWTINMHFDRIGSAVLRPGITLLGSQIIAAHSIVGLFQFFDTGTGTNDQIVAVCNTSLYYLSAGVWTARRTGLTADSKARFTNFCDLLMMVNGKEAMASWTGASGSAFSTATNVTSAPVAYFIDNFRSRAWAAKTDTNPSRVYYSSIADASYGIAWTGSVGEGYIDVAPLDGEDITGIKKWQSALYVFKNSAVYKIFSINESQPDPVIQVGTYSQESVIGGKDALYWHHPSGIYKMVSDTPQEISRPIYDIIKAIPSSAYANINAGNDDDHVWWDIGSVTVNNITIGNCRIRWTISTQIWTVYSYSSAFKINATYDTGTSITRISGDSNGNVFTVDSGLSDNGAAINYELETRWYALSGLRSEKKTIRKMTALHENAQGANLGWRNGTMQKNEIQPIKQLGAQETVCDNLRIEGHRLRFSIRGVSLGSPITFQGFEVLDWINQGVV